MLSKKERDYLRCRVKKYEQITNTIKSGEVPNEDFKNQDVFDFFWFLAHSQQIDCILANWEDERTMAMILLGLFSGSQFEGSVKTILRELNSIQDVTDQIMSLTNKNNTNSFI